MKTDTLDLRHMDCMELMAEYPDNHFDLAVVDPPYGIDAANLFSGEERKSGKGNTSRRRGSGSLLNSHKATYF